MQLRGYQTEAVDALFSYFNSKSGNPLIALPTATGKSLVIASFCARALHQYPTTRILMLTHVKELINQNYTRLKQAWPAAPAGVYSAGMRRKDLGQRITFGGVQSVANNVEAFGHIDLVGIDEAHLVSPDEETRYQQVIAGLKQANPRLKVFGLTATWWRLKQGSLTNSGLFTDICYNKTKPQDFQRFIGEGFLSPLVAKATNLRLDVSEVGLINGEYNAKQLEAAVDKDEVTEAACRELCNMAHGRKAWLLFCSGIAHAEHVAQLLNTWGIRTGCVHSKSMDRDAQLNAWYRGELRAMTNNNVLTTGIDYPAIDLIAMLRPTQSSSLWVQMLGRGMRIARGKTNCLVADFASNTARLGPVDDPIIPGEPRPGPPGDAPVKICPQCSTYNYASARYCAECGYLFPIESKLDAKSSDLALMSSDLPVIESFPVTAVTYQDYLSKKERRSIKVTYFSGIRAFSEYVSIGATDFAGHNAKNWWMQRHPSNPPETIEQALMLTSQLRQPTRIRVWVNKKYPEIMQAEWH